MENFTSESSSEQQSAAVVATPPAATLPKGRLLRQAAWSFVGANFWRLVGVTTIGLLVSSTAIIAALILSSLVESDATTPVLYASAALAALMSVVTSAFTLSLMAVTTVVGKEVSIGATIRRTFALFWPLSLTVFLAYGVMGAGFLFFIIPGIIMSMLLVPMMWVVTDEGLTLRAALVRSIGLVSGRWWAVTGRLILALLLVLLLSLGFLFVGILIVPLFFTLSFINMFVAAIISGLLALSLYITVSTVLGFYLLRYSYELYRGLRDTVTPDQNSWWQGVPLTILMVVGVCLGAVYLGALPHIMIEDAREKEAVMPAEFFEWEKRNPDFIPVTLPEIGDVEAI